MTLYFEKRDLVVPGDLLAEGDYTAGENTYKVDDKIYATHVGLMEVKNNTVYVIALHSFYVPKVGDLVIGKVVDISLGGWVVDINAPYLAMLKASDVFGKSFKPFKDDLSKVFDVGDLILAKVIAYDRTRNPLLTVKEPGLGKITRGRIVSITPAKVPRVIGKKGSMINLLKQGTGCQITVGMNGLVLVIGKKPENEVLCVRAIKKIERESHVSGLTDRIAEMLRKEAEK